MEVIICHKCSGAGEFRIGFNETAILVCDLCKGRGLLKIESTGNGMNGRTTSVEEDKAMTSYLKDRYEKAIKPPDPKCNAHDWCQK